MLIDLHVHSNESDGSFTPEELIDKAIGQNIDTLALCDHDTTAGHKRWQKYGKHKNITLIPGV
ncbi:MAG TPA: PHP domain-containing protein, partial [Spirochaetota bacterium]|nr:PHP domain-containing protein [Spirochaetota bacterium]